MFLIFYLLGQCPALFPFPLDYKRACCNTDVRNGTCPGGGGGDLTIFDPLECCDASEKCPMVMCTKPDNISGKEKVNIFKNGISKVCSLKHGYLVLEIG